MNKQDAKANGVQQGSAAIRYCEVSETDKREANCDCESVCEDCLTSAAYESEMNARQYSPFEFFAAEMNKDENRSDGLWSAYDEGVRIGIRRGLKSRLEQLTAN